MVLIKNGAVAEDHWTEVTDGSPLPSGPAIVTLARFEAEREALRARGDDIGVKLGPDEPPERLGADLGRLGVIVLDFPAFNDGRPYSHARHLRGQLGYAGELRATGDVLRDQLFFMLRCGFDAFELPDNANIEAWLTALDEIGVVYQPTADGRVPVMARRHSGS